MKRAEAEINQLAMKAQFQIVVTANREESAWSTHGWDLVEYRIATNPGEPLKPLTGFGWVGLLSAGFTVLSVVVAGFVRPAEGGLGAVDRLEPVKSALIGRAAGLDRGGPRLLRGLPI